MSAITVVSLDVPKRKVGRPRKVIQMSAPTTDATAQDAVASVATQTTETTQKTVFDLKTFSDTLLKKPFSAPPTVKSVDEALAVVGNDSTALIKVINDGLQSHARLTAYNDTNGWFTTDDDGKMTNTPYTGQFADEKMGKAINKVILNIALMNAGGEFSTPAQRKELKEQAEEFLRQNPAMIQGMLKPLAPVSEGK